MENIIPFIIQAGELIGAAILGGWISRVLTIRSRVRQENAGASKAEAEAEASQIDNIKVLVEKVYKPTIETLTEQVQGLQKRVDELERENAQLRTALREIQPDLVPSRKSVNASNQPRLANGRFTKKEEA